MNHSKPSISIIVPVFNVERYLNDAIDSLLNQKSPASEIILIDDGSTDGSAQILDGYSAIPTIKIFKTSNNGLGPARNLGRMLAKSEYVYFFDSDDLLDPNFTLRMYQVIIEFDYPDLIMFGGEPFYDEGYIHSFSPTYRRTISGVFESSECLPSEMLKRQEAFASPCLYLSRNEVWSHNRLVFPPHKHEDEAVLFPLLALSRKTVVLTEIYFRRRIRKGSIMTLKVDADNVNGLLRAIHAMNEFMMQEPALVKPDLGSWRTRLADLNVYYLRLGREAGVNVSWPTIISCLILASRISPFARVVFAFLPKTIQRLVKKTEKMF